jgi:pimeloyl-ACP methyl ester carboxylesterase
MQQPIRPAVGRVATEGGEIYYECRGQGQPLPTIAGGLGDAGIYSFVAESRDAVAVLHAAGEESAIVFGNSSGAVIGLETAKTQPHAVEALIAHEPPVLRILPDADRWLAFIAQIYLTALTDSPQDGGCELGSSR